MEELDLGDPTPIEVPIAIGDKKYILKEADGEASTKYRNHRASCMKFNPEGGWTGISGPVNDAEHILISSCLFEIYDQNGEIRRRPVIFEQVKRFPHRIQKALFEKAKEISGLEDDQKPEVLEKQIVLLQKRLEQKKGSEDQVKNLSSSTPGGSD